MDTISFADVVEYPDAAERAAQATEQARAWLDSHPLAGASAFMATPAVRPVSATWTDAEQTFFEASWYAQ